MCKHSNVLSRPVLMVRGLDGFFDLFVVAAGALRCAAGPVRFGVPGGQRAVFKGPARAWSHRFSVVIARGTHLFPFRTEQLSPSAPMVLGPHGPGRVGRRRFMTQGRSARGGPCRWS